MTLLLPVEGKHARLKIFRELRLPSRLRAVHDLYWTLDDLSGKLFPINSRSICRAYFAGILRRDWPGCKY